MRRTAGCGYGEPVQVPVDVEVGVLDPDRVVDPERHRAELAVEGRERADPSVEVVAEPLERVAVRHRGRVEQQQAADVHQLRRALEVEEAGVEAAEPVHARIVQTG
jgi:hypothetical protein